MIAKIPVDIEDGKIVVELFDLKLNDIVELHSNMFQTLLDSIKILLSIVVLTDEFIDGWSS